MRSLLLASLSLLLAACNAADSDFTVVRNDQVPDDGATGEALTTPAKVTLDSEGVMSINGVKTFPIGFTMPPPPGALAPNGRNAFAELKSAGANFIRTGPIGEVWSADAIAQEQKVEDAAALYGLHTWLYLKESPNVINPGGSNERLLRQLVTTFKNHPALGAWKSVDEPQWAGPTKYAIPALQRGYDILKQLDPDHPVVIIQAPRGTVADLRAFNPVSDIQGTDIYPISYPPGVHSEGANKDLSMVADYTDKMMQTAAGTSNGTWMTLQIAWSGVINPGKTLRMPTFFEERYMAYAAIIHGARGLFFFGGHLHQAWTPQDANYGWAWNFWSRVMRPLVQEIGEKGPLYPALVAPTSKLAVTSTHPAEIDFTVRQVGTTTYLLAAKNTPGTEQVTFHGLPLAAKTGEVMYEAPRSVELVKGSFSDWFAPHEVHVYKLTP